MKRLLSRFTQTLFVFSVLWLGMATNAQATHSMGTDLTYTCIGNNQYQVTLTFYRDCNGIPAPTAPTINWTASCGSNAMTLNQINMQEITPTCPGIVGTACNGGNGIYGIEQYTYQGVLTLPTGCTNIDLSFELCCRNNAITTLATPGAESIHVDVNMADAATCNNSPVFTNMPVPFVCAGQPVFYNHGAVDVDGDSLVYSLTDCYSMSGSVVGYGAGYSSTNPLSTTSGFNINASTGAISFTPSIAQIGVVCVLVEEFRNGTKIGSIVRDIQFTVVNCNNTMPTLSGVNNTTSYTTSATVGTQLCFDVFSNDVDSGQTTTLNWNASINGATFTSAGSPHATGTFCWTPTAADVGTHTFTVTVQDNYCPIVGQNTYTYTIIVTGNGGNNSPCDSVDVNVVSTSDVTCSSNDGSAVINASNGVAPYDYQLVNWTTGQFYSNTTGNFNNLTPGNYSVWVVDANGCTPACTGHTFVIGGNPVPLTAAAVATDVPCPSNSTNVQNAANTGGTITVNVTGGTAPYLYSLNGFNFQSSNFFGNLGTGTYNLVVIDANGCSQIVTATVGEPDPMTLSIASITPATCGQSNGSITLTATGGDGVYFYYLNGQSQGSNPTFTGLAAGTYTFSVCDASYCVYDTTFTIPSVAGFTVAASNTAPSCHGDCDGTATVNVTGNNTSATITWNNGMTGPSISSLCAGTYTATVTDANGCSATASTTIADPAPITVAVVSTSDESCQGNDGAVSLSVTGGTNPYTINIANFNNSSTYTNSSGVFTGLNGGQYVVNVTDANGCSESCATHFTLGCCATNTNSNVGGPTMLSGGTSLTPAYLTVNPNPASSMVQVSYSAEQERAGINIIDGSGKEMLNRQDLSGEGSLEINVSEWNAATYFILLRGKEGKLIKTTRLVIRTD